MSFCTYEHWINAIDKDGTLCISYGKDSLACLRAIELLGWNLKRIVHAEVWATDTIPGDLPPNHQRPLGYRGGAFQSGHHL